MQLTKISVKLTLLFVIVLGKAMKIISAKVCACFVFGWMRPL